MLLCTCGLLLLRKYTLVVFDRTIGRVAIFFYSLDDREFYIGNFTNVHIFDIFVRYL
jgi:hypothetical protein